MIHNNVGGEDNEHKGVRGWPVMQYIGVAGYRTYDSLYACAAPEIDFGEDIFLPERLRQLLDNMSLVKSSTSAGVFSSF